MGWRVTLTDKAEADLEAAVAFLAGYSPAVAERLGLELVEVIFSLDELPHRGAPVRARPGLRKLSHRYYLIYYQVVEATQSVVIVRLWDGRKDPAGLALT
jgi:plasmid stabilization system protein ParE